MKKYITTSLILLSVISVLATTAHRQIQNAQQQTQNPQQQRRSLTPDELDAAKAERFNRFVALLATVGITVDKSYLHDTERDAKHKVMYVKWEAYKDAPEIIKDKNKYAVSNKFTVKETKVYNGGLRRPREFEISNDLLFIAAVDEKSRLVWWTEEGDPRILYTDTPNPDGTYSGGPVTISAPDLPLDVPDEPRIKEVRIYEFSKVNGNDALTSIGSIPVNQ